MLAQLITAADAFSAATGILVTLGTSAPWLFTGTGLTVAIALGRGWRPQSCASLRRDRAGTCGRAVAGGSSGG